MTTREYRNALIRQRDRLTQLVDESLDAGIDVTIPIEIEALARLVSARNGIDSAISRKERR